MAAAATDLTVASVMSMKVAELKPHLEGRGLDKGGSRSEMRKRLAESVAAELDAAAVAAAAASATSKARAAMGTAAAPAATGCSAVLAAAATSSRRRHVVRQPRAQAQRPARCDRSCEGGSLRGCACCCSFMADCIDCGEPVYTKVEKDAGWKATMARCRGCRLAWLSRPGW